MKGAIRKAEELKLQSRCFIPGQFDNPGQIRKHTYKPQQRKYGTTQTVKWTSS